MFFKDNDQNMYHFDPLPALLRNVSHCWKSVISYHHGSYTNHTTNNNSNTEYSGLLISLQSDPIKGH